MLDATIHLFAKRTLLPLSDELFAARTRPAAAQSSTPHELMPMFWTVVDRHAAAGVDASAIAIRGDSFMPSITVYRVAGIGRVDLARWLMVFLPMADDVRRLSLAFPVLWDARAARFAEAVPD